MERDYDAEDAADMAEAELDEVKAQLAEKEKQIKEINVAWLDWITLIQSGAGEEQKDELIKRAARFNRALKGR